MQNRSRPKSSDEGGGGGGVNREVHGFRYNLRKTKQRSSNAMPRYSLSRCFETNKCSYGPPSVCVASISHGVAMDLRLEQSLQAAGLGKGDIEDRHGQG